MSLTTPFSTNAVSALFSAGITNVIRIERSTRYQLKGANLTKEKLSPECLLSIFGDQMLECIYTETIDFSLSKKRESVVNIDVLSENGRQNLMTANDKFGLGFDEADFEFYYDFFTNKVKKNPTNVELFDLAQSNSEHSRHWFFKSKLFVDGVERKETLFESIQKTQNYSNKNNVIAFCDNSRYKKFLK